MCVYRKKITKKYNNLNFIFSWKIFLFFCHIYSRKTCILYSKGKKKPANFNNKMKIEKYNFCFFFFLYHAACPAKYVTRKFSFCRKKLIDCWMIEKLDIKIIFLFSTLGTYIHIYIYIVVDYNKLHNFFFNICVIRNFRFSNSTWKDYDYKIFV